MDQRRLLALSAHRRRLRRRAWGDGSEIDVCPLSLYLDVTGQTFEDLDRGLTAAGTQDARGPKHLVAYETPLTRGPEGAAE